jgi:hypothetical protein
VKEFIFFCSVKEYSITDCIVRIPAAGPASLVEDVMMKVTQPSHINSAALKVKHSDTTILLAYMALTIVFLIAIYMASMSPGTAPGEFSSMTVFP